MGTACDRRVFAINSVARFVMNHDAMSQEVYSKRDTTAILVNLLCKSGRPSDNGTAHINRAPRRARLVLGWVTIRVDRLRILTDHPGQLCHLFPGAGKWIPTKVQYGVTYFGRLSIYLYLIGRCNHD